MEHDNHERDRQLQDGPLVAEHDKAIQYQLACQLDELPVPTRGSSSEQWRATCHSQKQHLPVLPFIVHTEERQVLALCGFALASHHVRQLGRIWHHRAVEEQQDADWIHYDHDAR